MQKAIELLKQYTNHKNILLTDRGNSAILASLILTKQENKKTQILIPDQGGWFTFKTYPPLLNFKIKTLKTNKGIINLKELKKNINNSSALLLTSFAGYAAEQPIKEISEITKKHNTLLIEDASGAITDKTLANGKYSDIILASFGKWKTINLNYGGFLSTNIENLKIPSSIVKVHNNIYKDLIPKLNNKRITFLLKKQTQVKKELKKFKIFHGEKRGLNILTEYNERIINYCKQNNYPFILCPNYTRLNEKAISIELKRLE